MSRTARLSAGRGRAIWGSAECGVGDASYSFSMSSVLGEGEKEKKERKKDDGNKTGDRLSESCNPPARSGVTDGDGLGQRASLRDKDGRWIRGTQLRGERRHHITFTLDKTSRQGCC